VKLTLCCFFTCAGFLYVGGVERNKYLYDLPQQIASRQGFQGCLGSLEINGRLIDILGPSWTMGAGLITNGCTGIAADPKVPGTGEYFS